MVEHSVSSAMFLENNGIEHTYVDMSELDEVKAAIRPNTKMFFIETPTNPMMKVADIHALSEIAKGIGALTVVDNTFLTPYFQKPFTAWSRYRNTQFHEIFRRTQ